MFGSWYMAPFNDRIRERSNGAEFDSELNRIVDFEWMLSDGGVLIVKFWCHLSKKEQRNRLKQLKRDDRSRWKMAPKLSKFSQQYDKFERIAERLIRHTDSGVAPWFLIEATDRCYRDLTVGKTLLHALEQRLNSPVITPPVLNSHAPSFPIVPEAQPTVLDHIDLGKSLDREDYKTQLKLLQQELNELAWKAYNQKRSCVMVFEGVDAGGKGGAIRRVTNSIDARLYQTIPIAAPTDEEKVHHYLWRFWRHIPPAGRLTVFDRSWYGPASGGMG